MAKLAEETALTALAEHVLGSADEAAEWLHGQHLLLDGRAPIEVARTQDGAAQVERLLRNIEFGLPV